jgi:signal transduction histidine kinase
MVLGATCSPVEIDWLIKLSRPLARSISMSRKVFFTGIETPQIGESQARHPDKDWTTLGMRSRSETGALEQTTATDGVWLQSSSRLELEANQRVLESLMDNMPASMYLVDSDYTLGQINLAAARRVGQPPSAMLGLACYKALYQRSDPCPDCLVAETLSAGRSTIRHTSRPGEMDEILEWEVRSYAVLDDGGKIVHAILFEQDISEKSRLESFVAQSEKLAALGQLAASVAHEISNPLTAIIANAQILQRELPAGDDRLESVDLIALAGARAAQMVRNLLDFARKEQGQLVLTNINDTLRSALSLIQHELMTRSISLSFDAAENLPQVMVRADSLQGVWLNLLLNAIESIERMGGMIRVSSRRVGDEVQVSIVDNGRGIPPERLERIFEPFYTTKAPGRGTGLGLSVCSRIIEQHRGRLLVQSHVGVGSQFTVILPVL